MIIYLLNSNNNICSNRYSSSDRVNKEFYSKAKGKRTPKEDVIERWSPNCSMKTYMLVLPMLELHAWQIGRKFSTASDPPLDLATT